MRWRLVDRIDGFEPWRAIAVRKAVSLEEYSLLEPFGRRGTFPESLVLGSCVEAVRWLVSASSDFALTAVLCQVGEFRWEDQLGMGQVLEISATVEHRAEWRLHLACRAASGGAQVARGRIGTRLLPMEEGFEPELVRATWRELCGTT